MSDKLIDEISAVLHRDGFNGISKHSSSTSMTLSAERDGERVLFHLTHNIDPASAAAVPLTDPAKGLDVKVKASFPGIEAVGSRVGVSRTRGQLQRRKLTTTV